MWIRLAAMASQDVRLELDRSAIRDLGDQPGVQELAVDAGEQMADYMRLLAPKNTGEGARSIQAFPGHDSGGAFADVSWDQDHYYMIFAEFGTQSRPEEPFARPAMDRYLRL
jgi:HK97 gp10 family phage protein